MVAIAPQMALNSGASAPSRSLSQARQPRTEAGAYDAPWSAPLLLEEEGPGSGSA